MANLEAIESQTTEGQGNSHGWFYNLVGHYFRGTILERNRHTFSIGDQVQAGDHQGKVIYIGHFSAKDHNTYIFVDNPPPNKSILAYYFKFRGYVGPFYNPPNFVVPSDAVKVAMYTSKELTKI